MEHDLGYSLLFLLNGIPKPLFQKIQSDPMHCFFNIAGLVLMTCFIKVVYCLVLLQNHVAMSVPIHKSLYAFLPGALPR